jgi:hypothetical protein
MSKDKKLVLATAWLPLLIVFFFVYYLSVKEASASELWLEQPNYDSSDTLSGFNGILQTFETPDFGTATTTFDKFIVRFYNSASSYVPHVGLCKGVYPQNMTSFSFCGSGNTLIHDWDGTDFVDLGGGYYQLASSTGHNAYGTELVSEDAYFLFVWAQSNTPFTVPYDYNNSDWFGGDFYTFDISNNYGAQNKALYFELYADASIDYGAPVVLITPPPNSQTQVLIDSPIEFYSLPMNGTCSTNGSDQIYIDIYARSYTPTSTDFLLQNIDCTDHIWSANIGFETEGLHTLTVWAKDFVNNTTTPIYNFDYVSTEIFLYTNMSFNPDYWASTTPTTTPDSPWFNIEFDNIPIIGGYIKQMFNHIKSRFPWGYLDVLWTLWKNADASTATNIGFNFNITPEMGVSTTSTVSFPLLTAVNATSPDSTYTGTLNSIENKVKPWIWFAWGAFYIQVAYRIFRRKLNNNYDESID